MVATAGTGLRGRVASYLRQPYSRIVVSEKDGSFRAEILEFPGCIATGDTALEALTALDDIAAQWLEIALERGQSIPEPVENTEFSGRLVLRMPKSLHKKAARLAERDGISLNQFILTSLAEHVGERARQQNAITFNTAISGIGGTTGVRIVHLRNPEGMAGAIFNQYAEIVPARSAFRPGLNQINVILQGVE